MSAQDSLVFIDTNIFLDFYRATGSADFKLLNRLKRIQGKIITSHQVEMEFQKSRQTRLSDSFDKLKLKSASLLEIPGLFVGTTKLEELNTSRSQFEKSLNVLRSSSSAAIRNPASDDPVYKAAKDIFSFKSDFNLTRTNPECYRIGRLARRRFLFGYPPRKDRDTSIGDAVN
ncbi:MAG: PIN domain-containing protein [Chthoniobacterales bacterium]